MLALKQYVVVGIHIFVTEEHFFKLKKKKILRTNEITNNSGKQSLDKSHLDVFYINDILCVLLLEKVVVKFI